MLVTHPEHELWVEKYRPNRVADCILREDIQLEMEHIIKTGVIPNALFSGKPGCGKTTCARALCEELGYDYEIVNASAERGLDLIRERIQTFASTVSLSDSGKKCFILDEADRLPHQTQAALNNASEALSSNCSFIMTANYPSKILPSLHSRFPTTNFDIKDKEQMAQMQAKFFRRCSEILKNEGVEFDKKVLIAVIAKYFPDNRLILNSLQKFSRIGKLDENVLTLMDEMSVDKLVEAIKSKKLAAIKQFAEDHGHSETAGIYDKLYDLMWSMIEPKSIPDAVAILHEFQKYDEIVPSKRLHLTAMAMTLSEEVEFK